MQSKSFTTRFATYDAGVLAKYQFQLNDTENTDSCTLHIYTFVVCLELKLILMSCSIHSILQPNLQPTQHMGHLISCN